MDYTELAISNCLLFLQKINLVPAECYATQVNTIIDSCSTCNHFDMCKPTTVTDEMFTLLLRFIRKQLHNSGTFFAF